MYAAEKLKSGNEQGCATGQEPLMVEFVEYFSDVGEEGFPWLH